MKNLFMLMLVITLFSSCDTSPSQPEKTYDDIALEQFNALKSPVILISKEKTIGGYHIVVKDANKVIQQFGDMSIIGSSVGASRNVGDTLK